MNSSRPAVVLTSINPPTEAVRAFAALGTHRIVVVGDRKTPAGWHCAGAEFLPIHESRGRTWTLAALLPFDHYCRKMLGYLHAIATDAPSIADTDDDNIPESNWGFPAFVGRYERLKGGQGFLNVYHHFTPQPIWPRGLPLRQIRAPRTTNEEISTGDSNVGVWQGLANEDPDVDAIYRLTSDTPCVFSSRPPLVLAPGTLSPFNSQNTLFRRELYPLLYLPTTVSFRFTDILRSIVAQPIMWAHGYELGFIGATVVQRRNPHDYYKDFLSEIPMYRHTERASDLVRSSVSCARSMKENLTCAYAALAAEGIVEHSEAASLSAWLHDLEGSGS